MTRSDEDRFSILRRNLVEREDELAAHIAQLRSRRVELAAGRPITPPDVERASAAATESREHAAQAHRAAAAGYLAAAEAHDTAAEGHVGDASAHRRAADEDRRRAAKHRAAACEEG